jgi:hypothetical protein
MADVGGSAVGRKSEAPSGTLSTTYSSNWFLRFLFFQLLCDIYTLATPDGAFGLSGLRYSA